MEEISEEHTRIQEGNVKRVQSIYEKGFWGFEKMEGNKKAMLTCDDVNGIYVF